jgi:hypothetical protein
MKSTMIVSVIFSLALLGGCKLTVLVDTGGQVFSQSGDYSCNGGDTSCTYTVPDDGPFVETFAAVPDLGYKFAGWEGSCETTQSARCVLALSAAITQQASLAGSLRAHFNRPIVGTWIFGDINSAGDFATAVFYENGYYIISEFCPGEGGSNDQGGYEHGSYTWNAATGAFNATVISDSIGDCGARDIANGPNFDTVFVSGDQLSLVSGDAYDVTLDRLIPASANEITGTWISGDITQAGGFAQLTFLSDSRYLVSEACFDTPQGDVPPGLEYGTYSWDKTTKVISNNVPLLDTMDECGLYDEPGSDDPITGIVRKGRNLIVSSAQEGDETFDGVF